MDYIEKRQGQKGVDKVNRMVTRVVGEEVEQVVEQDDTMEKKEMAQTQLHFMAYAAKEILEFIDMGGEIEEWYQNKLSKVQSEVESLHSYIEGEKRRLGMVKEESEQVDEKINLVKAKMGDVIKDFQKSDAPQFKGKSAEERRKMALAAKLGAEREAGMREEVEQVEEGAKDWKKAFQKVAAKNYEKDIAAVRSSAHRLDKATQSFPAKPDTKPTDSNIEYIKQKARKGVTKPHPMQEEEAEGKVAVTPKEKDLAAHHGDPKRITRGDVIKARLKSAASKKMGKE
jgi:hypothetical protein